MRILSVIKVGTLRISPTLVYSFKPWMLSIAKQNWGFTF
jgi:hypothetical protein